ncbi:M15 family metallopeptidase [Thalassotalea ponticola]|uniref:M15 family metallopeptidase n=1 Tax=Thalassotalea ponticola TaxID=1523392 RepID=UPI0025B54BA2|nr:M15 family metallopeptidase [Thalassotalea ponticola]MDN3651251.1 M15 family metallopeptidase [Thalassotalea ponticola]
MTKSAELQITSDQVYGLSDQHIYYLANGQGVHLGMINAFEQLQNAAATAGFNLQIASGFRNFERQLALFEAKILGQRPVKDRANQPIDCSSLSPLEQIKAVMLFSALPGASRHHWGTDIDVYDPTLQQHDLQLEPWEYQSGGPQAPLASWLTNNMHLFGFYRPYDRYRSGVSEEPWHLSYAPLSHLYMQAFQVDTLAAILDNADLVCKQALLANLTELCQQFVFNINTPDTSLCGESYA